MADEQLDTTPPSEVGTFVPDDPIGTESGPIDNADAPEDTALEEVGDEVSDDEDTGDVTDAVDDEPVELDDDTVQILGKAYKEKLLEVPEIKEEIERIAQENVNQRLREQARLDEVKSDVDKTIERGKIAIQAVNGSLNNAREAIKAAIENNEPLSEKALEALNPELIAAGLRDYGQSIIAATELALDSSIEDSFDRVFSTTLPEMTEDQARQLATIVHTAERMKGDPRQANMARPFFFAGLLHFVATCGIQTGMAKAQQAAGEKSKAAERIAKSNAVKAAKAGLERNKLPPKTPASVPDTNRGSSATTMEGLLAEYDAAKRDKNYPAMDDIMGRMSKLRQGQPFQTSRL